MKLSFQKINRIFAIFIVLLFIAHYLNIDVKLSSFIADYFTYFLLVFLLSLAIILYDVAASIQQKNKHQFEFNQENKNLVNKLKKLSYEEKNILALYMTHKVQEKSLDPNDQAVAWLESVKFITNTTKIDGNKRVFRIDPTLSKHLTQNPNTLY